MVLDTSTFIWLVAGGSMILMVGIAIGMLLMLRSVTAAVAENTARERREYEARQSAEMQRERVDHL